MTEKLKRLLHVFDLRKFVKFGLIGVLNTLVDFVVFYFMNRLIGDGPSIVVFGALLVLGPYISNTVSYIVANIHSFLWNKFWTFEKRQGLSKQEVARYLCTSVGYLLVSSACLGLCINLLHLSPVLSKLPTACVTIFYNYLMNKFWVFK